MPGDARIDLGLYVLETSVADEYLTWPCKGLSTPRWVRRADRGCAFRLRPAVAHRGRLFAPLQRKRTKATSALVAIIFLKRPPSCWQVATWAGV